ncbi:MAG TPA: class I SAM-dependent methyltransferase [Smithellaceae bacterium]|nr:class I SAM-dependent methyltransferase [Smithellaceae bacterium]
MNILKLFNITKRPKVYETGSSTMWTDPYISKQLLKYHLASDNDMASRSNEKIELIVDWIQQMLGKNNIDILDLGCGPGLYAERFAIKGHKVSGIDFSENSIKYAKKSAAENNLDIEYMQMDYRELKIIEKYDLAVLIYLDFCVLNPDDAKNVLKNIYKSLKPEGMLLLDVINERNIDSKIMPQSWEVAESGFWKETPYIAMSRGYHYPEEKLLLNQHIVIDSEEKVDKYNFWSRYYEEEEMKTLLEMIGYREIKNHESILPPGDCWNGENVTFYTAKK